MSGQFVVFLKGRGGGYEQYLERNNVETLFINIEKMYMTSYFQYTFNKKR